MITAFHIMTLVKELNHEAAGAKIVATEFYKKERTAIITFKKKSRLSLVFSYHPTKNGIFLIPPSKLKIETREKPWPIFSITKGQIDSIEQIGFDRLLKINIEIDSVKKQLIFETLGPNGNIWLLNDKGEKEGSLRKRTFDKKESYTPPKALGRLNPLELTVESLLEKAHEVENTYLGLFLEKNIAGLNKTLAKELIKRSQLDNIETDELTKEQASILINKINELLLLFNNAETGYLYELPGRVEAYPMKLSHAEIIPEKYKSLWLAQQESSERKSSSKETVDEEKATKDLIKKAIKKLTKRLDKITQDIEQAADYELNKKLAELLKINFNSLKKGMESIMLSDIFSNDQTEISIKLDPALSPNENSEAYFKKYRKGREGLALLKRRREITLGEIESLEKIGNELELNFEAVQQRYSSEIQALLPKEHENSLKTVRLPYREYTLSTGLTIFIGRDGADNDRTTFDFAKPYELWFHTQQCPGSHVVMKFPNKNFEPSKKEIEETASIAAYHSKARNDSMVPVIYTQRKYVRKPRKAKPGLVSVEREKSVMVVPKSN